MSLRLFTAIAAAALTATTASAGSGPLQVTTRVLVERRVAAADGTTRILASPGSRAAPGDRLVVELAYRNTGARPIADLVLADPVPGELAYRAPGPGSPIPELSVDGTRFAPLADLAVPVAGGGSRPAGEADVVAIRWRIAGALAPGASGTLAYRAVLK